MKKEFKTISKEKGVVQITTADERWYARETTDPSTGLPSVEFVPSVTWIASYYPKGIGFMKWLANHGWDEAEAIKIAAGDKGSKVHQAIETLIAGKTVAMQDMFPNKDNGQLEELTAEEYEAIYSFVAWFQKAKPEPIHSEIVVFQTEGLYAGTVDFVCKIDGQLYIVDFKTSQNVWPSHHIQVAAYKHASHEWQDAKLAILQIGYKRNRAGWKFNEIADQYDLFRSTYRIWQNECANIHPRQIDLPLELSLNPTKHAKIKSNSSQSGRRSVSQARRKK